MAATAPMIITSDVHVRIDDRVRLMSAVLAITRTTDEAHTRRPHSAHAHARATRKQLSPFAEHAAVQSLQLLLDRGAPPEAIFGYALRLNLPDFKMDMPPAWAPTDWNMQLGDFYHSATLARWWADEHSYAAWDKSLSESQRLFGQADVHGFLMPFVGPSPMRFSFMPNISYPSEYEVGVRVGEEILCIAPPRAAWGDSPPWPFDEDPGHVYRASIGQYVRILMSELLNANPEKLAAAKATELPTSELVRANNPTWRDQFFALFTSGLIAIYLEDHMGASEAKGYLMMENKVHGMAVLPAVISVLRRFVVDQAAGKYETFADFLPLFPKQIRVARRIYSL